MNSINFIGNIGQDATTRYTANGKAITSFSVALSSGYGDNKITSWMNCSIFGERGEKLASYIQKGKQIGITGEFSARPWTNKDGVEKLSLDVAVHDVTLLGSKDAQSDSNTPPAKNNATSKQESGSFDEFNDEPPF